ncbi:MAG: hypothetical protein ACE15F_10850 [bacterium]
MAGFLLSPPGGYGDPDAYAPLGSLIYPAGRGTVKSSTEPLQYTFAYQDGKHSIEYEILLRDPTVIGGMISVRTSIDDKSRLIPIYQGGLIVQSATGSRLSPQDIFQLKTCQLADQALQGNTVHLFYEEELYGQKLKKEYAFSLRGKTLVIQASGDVTNSATASYVGFEFGKSRYTNNATILRLPACPIPAAHTNDSFFLSMYADPLLSTTGIYEGRTEVLNTRSIEVGNTPALLVPDASGRRPGLKVTAYVTISSNLADVLPVPPPRAAAPQISPRDRVFMDLHELPLVHRPWLPGGVIRRWEAPHSGTVSLKGAFALLRGDLATCEVYLLEEETGESALLFSQVLDPVTKPATGIEGNFPLEAGDQLLFASTGPAVMTGGDVGMNLVLRQGNDTYSSKADFSEEQGRQGWYYEQQIGPYRTLLIWNPGLKRWESPATRSYQTAERIVNRSGAVGDAFEEAQAFFDDLDFLGLRNLAFPLRDWSRHAGLDSSSAGGESEAVWGTSQNLLRLSQTLMDKGNQVIDVIGVSGILPAGASVPADIASATSPLAAAAQGGWLERSLSALQNEVAAANRVMYANGLLLDFPAGLERILGKVSPCQWLGLNDTTSPAVYSALRDWSASLRKSASGPLMMAWNDSTRRYDLYAASLFDALMIPSRTDSNALNLVEEELHVGRIYGPRIGFGTYSQYYQNPHGGEIIDLRLFPIDHYLASTLACGRIPYISSRVWFPGIEERVLRRYLLEAYCLLAPAAREYLDPANAVTGITYQAGDDTSLSVVEVIKKKKLNAIDRIAVQYANGLRIYANYRSKSWLAHPEEAAGFEIGNDGFLAWNGQTGLLAMTGVQGFRPYSVCQTPQSLFLHSRDGKLTRHGSLATDGMVYRRMNAYSAFPDMTSLAATEISLMDPMSPILRSNNRVDCAWRWRSSTLVELRIYHAEPSPTLLELFEFPSEWFQKDSPLTVERSGEGGVEKPPFQWYIVESNQRKGIRFTDIETGDRYAITFGAAGSPKSAPEPKPEIQSAPETMPDTLSMPASSESQPQSQPGDLTPSPLPE